MSSENHQAEASRREDEPTPEPRTPPVADRDELGSTMMHAGAAHADREHPSWTDLLTKADKRIRAAFAGVRVPPPYELDDLVVITMQQIYRDLPQIELRDRVSFWAWVRRIAEHRLADMGREEATGKRGGAARIRSLDNSEHAQPLEDRRALTASILARTRELDDALRECLTKLRPETATVLQMRLLDHLSCEEIAPRIGRNKSVTVRSIFMRGRKRLAACLRAKGFDDWSGGG